MLDTAIGGYSLLTLCWYFVGYSFFGWLVEVLYAYMRERRFVNRGFLLGPFWDPFVPSTGSGLS